jgi:competence ComEA-like helix-hairpin-helix protein
METCGYQWRHAGRVAAVFLICSVLWGCTSAEPLIQQEPEAASITANETININTANKDELQRIPYIGERLAEEIIEHREKHGPFRRAEHLVLHHGISDRRFREVRHLIRID